MVETIKKFWNLKAAILAFEIAFIFCFFTGTFHNPGKNLGWHSRIEVFNEQSWYYINRGLFPTSWAGVSWIEKTIDFPIIKMPFLTRKEYYSGKEFNKIVDLGVFTQLFLTVLVIAYLIAFPFGKAVQENKSLNYIFIPATIILFFLCIFIYFFIFRTI